jgi:hypothetical protein
MYKLCFYVPTADAEAVKQAVFATGAGRIGDYDCCAFEIQGTGQFRPLEGSNPHIGQQQKLEKVAESKVEMVCEDHLIKAAIQALIEAHPYEEPAYQCWQVLTIDEL